MFAVSCVVLSHDDSDNDDIWDRCQGTIIEQCDDRYTSTWWVNCSIWYSEEGQSVPVPFSLYYFYDTSHER